MYLFISVIDAQILNKTKVWNYHNIQPIIKISNIIIMQHETQTTGPGVMIDKCSPDSQHGGLDDHPANVGSSFYFGTNQRSHHKQWTREDNKLAIHCYFKSNSTQSRPRKRMIEGWEERVLDNKPKTC